MSRLLSRMRGAAAVLAGLGLLLAPTVAGAAEDDVQHMKFRYGPLPVTPGQNTNLVGPDVDRPPGDGFILRMRPDLERADGTPPPVDVIHLHHGVWVNLSGNDSTSPGGGSVFGGERFFAVAEEKTEMKLPPGYGYPVRADDRWLINPMIHNLTTSPDQVWVTYEVDWVPADSDLGRRLKPVRPVWMDVENGSPYPVFDTHRGTGGDGLLTYPDEAANPYGGGRRRNEWTVDRDGTLVLGFGHVHPGGLWDDLDLVRPGGARTFDARGHRALHRLLAKRHRRGHARLRRLPAHRRARAHALLHRRLEALHRRRHPALSRVRDSVHLFRSDAVYYDPNGPVSWDFSMTATDPSWRVGLKKGDRLRMTATYESKRASWYEVMGIIILYMSDEEGPDPFRDPPPERGTVTHGHLAENDHEGGEPTDLPDPRDLPDGAATNSAGIANFLYLPGDLSSSGAFQSPPVIRPGQQLRFENADSAQDVYHTITACRAPCNRGAGVSYPLADADVELDSGELGFGIPGYSAAANSSSWQTPADLAPGTYTYFCRVHPFMRGAFRVKAG